MALLWQERRTLGPNWHPLTKVFLLIAKPGSACDMESRVGAPKLFSTALKGSLCLDTTPKSHWMMMFSLRTTTGRSVYLVCSTFPRV